MVQSQDVATLKKELAKLGRLNQQLHNNALRDAEQYDENVRKLNTNIKLLERRLSEAKSEVSQYQVKAKKIEHENDELRQQLDQALVKQKLYDVPLGQQGMTVKQINKINSLDRPPVKPAPYAPNEEEARQKAIITMLHKKLADSQRIQDEQTQQIEALTSLLDKATSHLAVHENDTERLCNLLDTPGNATAVQYLNVQVSDLHHELSCTQDELAEEREKVSQYSQQNTNMRIEVDMLKAALQAKTDEVTLLSSTLEERISELENEQMPNIQMVHQAQQTVEEAPKETFQHLSVEQLISDKSVLQRQLEILGKDLLEAREESGKYLKQMVSLQSKVNSLLKEQTALKELVPTSNPSPATLSASAQTLVFESCDACTMTLETFESQLTETVDANLNLEIALKEVSNDRDELHVRLDEVSIKHMELQAANEELTRERDRLMSTVKDLQKHTSDQLVRIREEGEYTQREQHRVEELSTKLRHVESEKEQMSREILQASDDFRQMLRENSFLSQQLQEAIGQRDKVQLDLDAFLERAAEMEYMLKAKEEECNEVLAVYRQLCEEYEALKRKCSSLDLEVQRAREDIALEKRRTQDQHHETCASVAREQQSAIDLQSANFEIDALNKKVMMYFNEKNAMKREMEEALRRVNGHQSMLESVERKYQECERELMLRSNELEHVREQLVQTNGELQMTVQALEDEQREGRRLADLTNALKKKEAALFNKSQEMRTELGGWRQTAQETESQLQAAKHHYQYSEDALRHLQEKITYLEAELGQEKAARLKAEEQARVAKDNNMTLIRQYEAVQKLVETQDEELRTRPEE